LFWWCKDVNIFLNDEFLNNINKGIPWFRLCILIIVITGKNKNNIFDALIIIS